jgi:uncharacterized protein YbjT (DUF2867 family)
MKVLVTGATGYVGSRVVDQLLAEGHKVVGLCRNEERAKLLHSKGVEALIGMLFIHFLPFFFTLVHFFHIFECGGVVRE